MLEEPKHAELPWTLYLRALIARSRDEALELTTRSLTADPDLQAARQLQAAIRRRGSP